MGPVGRMKIRLELIFAPKELMGRMAPLEMVPHLSMPGLFLQIQAAGTWKFAKATVQWLLMWGLVLTASAVLLAAPLPLMPAPLITKRCQTQGIHFKT